MLLAPFNCPCICLFLEILRNYENSYFKAFLEMSTVKQSD